MSWLAKLTGMFRPKEPAYDPHADFETRSLYGMHVALRAEHVRHALSILPYAVPSDANVAFISAALAGRAAGTGMDLRSHGVLLTGDDLVNAGMRRNVKCSREYYDILTNRGREDPIHAASTIASMVNEIASSERRIANMEAALGKDCRVVVIPNTMAAGPCEACIELSNAPIPLRSAPRCALSSCPHPDQCVLIFRSELAFD